MPHIIIRVSKENNKVINLDCSCGWLWFRNNKDEDYLVEFQKHKKADYNPKSKHKFIESKCCGKGPYK